MSTAQTDIVTTTPDAVSETIYDVVIVGSGVAGAIVAKQLSAGGKSVLIVEAGTSEALTFEGFQGYVDAFYGAVDKTPNAPYPLNPNAPSPTDNAHGYFVEKGPLPLSGSYTRVAGGSTMHWEGKAPRMLPEDFQLRTRYGSGLDWPIDYDDLEPHYRMAEYELGVAGDTEEQRRLGVPFPDGYVFPIQKIPPSYLDEQVRGAIDGATVQLHGQSVGLHVSSFPQARNGEPNPDFVPEAGGVAFEEYGAQCGGNGSCVPICPYQAKYDALRTLATVSAPDRIHLLSQAVASKVEIDSETGRVTAIQYKSYPDRDAGDYVLGSARGRLYVLACNAVENARLMLASGLSGSSDLIGRHLMDHPYLLAWALMPGNVGAMRGPLGTSGIASFRHGAFRRKQSAFAVDIHNDGWGWAGIGVTEVLRDAVDNGRKYGIDLRNELISRISRQLLLAFMCELPADPANRVSVDPRHTDQLGNPRPVIHFDISDYCKQTISDARTLSREIFGMLQAEDHTAYDESDPSFFTYKGEGYWVQGGNHFAGTHVMGSGRSTSVVDPQLRSWDHPNLYLVGGGSMPSIGSANITLTLAALSFRASEQMLKDLDA
ncbi:MAG: GMC family oxidoreductase [Hyphomicrobiales bacterium]|nr:GMC family oxidoreductase [Hyphomicrobiales bacterium]